MTCSSTVSSRRRRRWPSISTASSRRTLRLSLLLGATRREHAAHSTHATSPNHSPVGSADAAISGLPCEQHALSDAGGSSGLNRPSASGCSKAAMPTMSRNAELAISDKPWSWVVIGTKWSR
eukprot:scaffold92143_cov69-Phaeocystis_antarctica.AAC.6